MATGLYWCFLSELLPCALWQLCMSTGFCWYLLSESLACALWQLCMATRLYWCLFVWITCMCIMTATHVHWILLVSFCLNHLYVHYDSYAWPLDCIGGFLSESLACASWQLCMSTGFCSYRFVWITCMCIMTAMHGHWILLVSFWLNHLFVHYDSKACPLDSFDVFLSESIVCALWQLCMATGFYWCLFVWITFMCIMIVIHGAQDCIGVFLSESLACALWQLSMATGFYWCLFVWITFMCIMIVMHGAQDCIGVFLPESLVCALWQLSMATGFYWCLFDWITCLCIMTAKHVPWILMVSFCLNQLYVHYESYAWPLDSIDVFLTESLVCALWQQSMAAGFY